MNTIFSVDDFSDLLWQPPVTVYALAISSSVSEWELLEEFPSPASSSARDNTALLPLCRNHQLHRSLGIVMMTWWISKSLKFLLLLLQLLFLVIVLLSRWIALHWLRPIRSTTTLFSSSNSIFPVRLRASLGDTCLLGGFLRMLMNELSEKPEGVSSLAEDQRVASKNFQSGSQVSGNGNGILKAQSEADGGSLRLPALPSTQRKQYVPARKTASGYSREDSDNDDLDGDIETNEHMDPADEKRARRMESNRESARRSRRRKQAQLNELEAQFGQLRDECTSLLTRLSDINKKCDEASADNRILTVNIETLRTKVKMAEDQVKRATDLNPVLLAGSNMPSVGMQFVAGQTDASARVAVHKQPNNNHLFHRSVPNISPQVLHLSMD